MSSNNQAARGAAVKITTDDERIRRLSQHGKALFRHAVTHQLASDESCRSDEDVSNITLRDNESIGSELENFDEWKAPHEDKDKDPRALIQRGSESLRATIANKRRAQNTFIVIAGNMTSAAAEVHDAVQRLTNSLATYPHVDACAVLSVLEHTHLHASGTATDPGVQDVSSALRAVLACLISSDASLHEPILQQSTLPPRVVASIIDTASTLAEKNRSVARAIPRLDRLDWRVDINVASSSLQSIWQPTIVLRLQLSNGHMHTVELSLERFHELRYNTAKILQEMNQLERHPILRLTRDGLTSTT